MNNIKLLPNLKILDECFTLDSTLGKLFWKVRPREHFRTESGMKIFNTRYSGSLLGSADRKYITTAQIDRIHYKLHRIIWKLYYREEPPSVIDHINGNTNDNRIENLRGVTSQENAMNKTKLLSNNTSGHIGVRYDKTRGKYMAYIRKDRKMKNLGRFETLEEAIEARRNAAIRLFGEFYNENTK